MDIRKLKEYIYDNGYVEQILESLGCHHIKYHTINAYWTCANPDGDNRTAICLYNNSTLTCINYTRQLISGTRTTDIIDLVSYVKDFNFVKAIQYLTDEIGMSYYHDFDDDTPESFKILDMLDQMCSNIESEKDMPLKVIDPSVLSYYLPYVNDVFVNDGIAYETQREFEIGYDPESNRYTIPIRSELGDLVGVKGRMFEREVPKVENKYVYLEPCPKSRVLYGLFKTLPYIQRKRVVYVTESEKGVLQLWSYGIQNCVATGGKVISQMQIDMLVRTGATVVLCYDKDVSKKELEEIAERFPDGIEVFCIYDNDNILGEKESPCDDYGKWNQLVKNNVYRIR